MGPARACAPDVAAPLVVGQRAQPCLDARSVSILPAFGDPIGGYRRNHAGDQAATVIAQHRRAVGVASTATVRTGDPLGRHCRADQATAQHVAVGRTASAYRRQETFAGIQGGQRHVARLPRRRRLPRQAVRVLTCGVSGRGNSESAPSAAETAPMRPGAVPAGHGDGHHRRIVAVADVAAAHRDVFRALRWRVSCTSARRPCRRSAE